MFAGGDSRPTTGGLLVIDPERGRVACRFPFRGKKYESVNASSPVVIGNRVFLSTSYATGSVLLDLKPDGSCAPAWRTDDVGLHFMTPVHRDGYLYAFDGSGKRNSALVCLDVKTGKTVWRDPMEWTESLMVNGRQRDVMLSTYLGSLLQVDGAFLALGEEGHLLWLDLSAKGCRVLARTRLFSAPQTWTPPVISRGLLYVAQNRPDTLTGTSPSLRCYDLRAAK